MTRTWSFLLLAFSGLVMLGAAPSVPEAWNLGTYEANPETTDNVAQGDDHIRDLKARIRERLNVEHHFSNIANGDNTDDNGLHRVGSARCFVDTTAPVTLCDPGTACTDHDNAGGPGVSALSDTATNSSAAEDVGDGRCWIDTDGLDGVAGTGDDNTLYVYQGNAWQEAAPGSVPPITAPNELYNGSFEQNGSTDTALPEGWTAVDGGGGGGTYLHAVTDVSEGEGLSVAITNSAGTLDGISQSLNELKADTTYIVVARVNPDVGTAATCRLDTDAATESGLPDNSTGTGSFEPLYGEFTTDNTPATVVVSLLGVGASDLCEWDHVGVYEKGTAPGHPSRWVSETVSTATTDLVMAGDSAIMTSDTFIAPHSSCIAFASANLSVTLVPAGNNYLFGLELHAQKDGGTWTDIGGHTIKGTGNNATGPSTSSFSASGYVTKASAADITMEAGSSYIFRYYFDSSGTDPSGLDMNCAVGSPACRLTVDFDCRQ